MPSSVQRSPCTGVQAWLVVEIKSVERLTTFHTIQCVGYLRLTELPLALLINFNVGLLRGGIRRIVPPIDSQPCA
jgi:GxxExxY protein